jgi:predicted protein tyrosine phosphatase
MSVVLVSSLSGIEGAIRRYRPSHLVSLLAPEHMIGTPPEFTGERHLRLGLNDVAEDWASESPPTLHHIESLLAFGRGWSTEAPILVHCWAGISRSMAAAYILQCDRARPGSELKVAQDIRARAPHACPNTLMIRLADSAMRREGRMIEAIASIGRGEIATEGYCVELPIRTARP